jgi:hypothetical protein
LHYRSPPLDYCYDGLHSPDVQHCSLLPCSLSYDDGTTKMKLARMGVVFLSYLDQ